MPTLGMGMTAHSGGGLLALWRGMVVLVLTVALVPLWLGLGRREFTSEGTRAIPVGSDTAGT